MVSTDAENLARDYALAFSQEVGLPAHIDARAARGFGIRRSVEVAGACASDLAFDGLACGDGLVAPLVEAVARAPRTYCEENLCDTLSFYGLKSDARPDGPWGIREHVSLGVDCASWTPDSATANYGARRARRRGVTCGEAATPEVIALLLKLDRLRWTGKASVDDRLAPYIHREVDAGRAFIVVAFGPTGSVVAGWIVLTRGGTAFGIVHAYSDSARPLFANDLLYAATIESARTRGMDTLNWGRVARENAGLIRMKAKYSDEIRPEYSLHWLGQLFCAD